MQQAARTSDYTAFMYLGRVIEYGQTNVLFTNPLVKDTRLHHGTIRLSAILTCQIRQHPPTRSVSEKDHCLAYASG